MLSVPGEVAETLRIADSRGKEEFKFVCFLSLQVGRALDESDRMVLAVLEAWTFVLREKCVRRRSRVCEFVKRWLVRWMVRLLRRVCFPCSKGESLPPHLATVLRSEVVPRVRPLSICAGGEGRSWVWLRRLSASAEWECVQLVTLVVERPFPEVRRPVYELLKSESSVRIQRNSERRWL